MSEQVIDASLAIKWFIKGERFSRKAQQLLRNARTKNITLLGPPILIYELESKIQQRLSEHYISRATADLILKEFYEVGFQIEDPPDMVQVAREIARRYNQERIYDSLYAALAQGRGCEFWTADRAFYEAVKRGLLFVKYVAEYP